MGIHEFEDELFESVVRESLEDDLAAVKAANATKDKLKQRYFNGQKTISKIGRKQSTIKIRDKEFYLADVDTYWPKLMDEKGNNLKTLHAVKDMDDTIHEILLAISRTFGIYLDDVFSIKTMEDIQKIKEDMNFVEELLPQVQKAVTVFKDTNKFDDVLDARWDKYLQADDDLWNKQKAARKSLEDETPDIEPEGYAVWHSKNGNRKVTVLSIDEPNKRAKINTAKGATMYVPLSTLEKLVDYNSHGLGDNKYAEE